MMSALSANADATVVAACGFGGQSMTAALRSVLVRRPAPPRHEDDWRRFGYLHPVNHEETEREHAAFQAILAEAGVEVIAAGPDSDGELDAIFAFDPSIVTDRGAVVCRLGKPERQAEADFAARTFQELGIPILGRIETPGTVEGGDTVWLDERTLAVGRGYRTNAAGIAQLAKILAPLSVEVMPVHLPHWRGPGECLHLMSLISPVTDTLAVVYLPLMATSFVELLQARGWDCVEVPDEEFESMGCNVLALAPGRCLMLDGNPITKQRLEAAGCEVLTYGGAEVSLNRAGGPTCLTKPLLRAV
jgi:N-dimethylarginine dimethylaminohydrolase